MKPYIEIDTIEQGWLPSNWLTQINSTIDLHGLDTILTGESALSREDNIEHISEVKVVFGADCVNTLPWLDKLYRNEFALFINRSMNIEVFPAVDIPCSININCLHKRNADYEKHVDTNNVTGLLFACNADATTGGQLVFEMPNGIVWTVNPKIGTFIAFDARKIPHFVSPLEHNFRRISVPMNYYDDPIMQHRPEGLDDRLLNSALQT